MNRTLQTVLLAMFCACTGNPQSPNDGGAGGGGGGGSGGGNGAYSCTWTLSGAQTDDGTCLWNVAYSQNENKLGLSFTAFGRSTPTFGGGVTGQTEFTAGTYTLSQLTDAAATYNTGGAPTWFMCNSGDCVDGNGDTIPNQGTFTLTISDPGPKNPLAPLWQQPHGTLQVSMPFDPDTGATGTLTLDATF